MITARILRIVVREIAYLRNKKNTLALDHTYIILQK